MRLNATIRHKRSVCVFEIKREAPGIYLAHLVCSEDENTQFPGNITLIRGIRNWKGSIEDATVLFQLGFAIENYYQDQKTL